jgi:quinol monooxygenase YgiN
MSVVVVATVFPRPESRPQVIELLEQVIPQVHAEDGCELYALHEAGDRLVMVEKWASRDALDAHLSSPAFLEMGRQLRTMVSQRPDVQVLSPHPAGTARQGALLAD